VRWIMRLAIRSQLAVGASSVLIQSVEIRGEDTRWPSWDGKRGRTPKGALRQAQDPCGADLKVRIE
jgi:hypothetical protein